MPPKGWKKYPEPGYPNVVLKNAHLPKKPSKLRDSTLPSTSNNSTPNKKLSKKAALALAASLSKSNAGGSIPRIYRSPTKASHMKHSSSPGGIRRSAKDGTPLLPASTPSDLCAYCEGTSIRNESGRAEEMVSCWECGSSGHPTCLDWPSTALIKRVGEYCWQCSDCKRCPVCDEKEIDDAKGEDEMLLCDRCDRGWHGKCLTPAINSIPKGPWTCPTCRIAAAIQTSNAPASQKRITVVPPTRPSPFPQRQSSNTGSNRKGKGRWMDGGDEDHFEDNLDRRGRTPLWEPEFDEEGDAIISTNKKKEKGKGRASDFGVSASGGPLKLTFRLGGDQYGDETPRKKHKLKKVEEKEWLKVRVIEDDVEDEGEVIEEEEDLPYGGVLVGNEAEVGDRKPGKEDRKKWERSRDAAEAKALQDLIKATVEAAADAEESQSTPAPSTPVPLESTVPLPTPELDITTLTTSLTSAGRPSRDRTSITIDTPAPLPQISQSHSWIGTPSGSTSTPATTQNGKGLALANIPIANIKAIRFGEFEIGTWYQAPFPEEYSRVADGKLWICEFCLKYMKGEFQAGRHRLKCKTRHPPGDEIYRDGKVSVFEVDGRKNKIYCQNLCLLAKMFLDHKTLYYDVEPFLFYVMTTAEATGAKFVGYFSKEKRSPTNNVSCIMTLPVRQRKGWGNLLIDFSYLLSKKEGRLGTPERPLSDLGLLSYRNYWTLILFQYLLVAPEPNSLTIEEISAKTAMTHDDIYFILNERNMIADTAAPHVAPIPDAPASPEAKVISGRGSNQWTTRKRTNKIATATVAGSSSRQPHEDDAHSVDSPIIPSNYKITIDKEIIEAHVQKWEKKDYLQLKPDKLQWSPFLVTRGYGLSTEVGSTGIDTEGGTNAIGALANGFHETTNAMGAYLGIVESAMNGNAEAGPSGEKSTDVAEKITAVEEDATVGVEARDKTQDAIETITEILVPVEIPVVEEEADIEMSPAPSSDPFDELPPIEIDDEEDEDYGDSGTRPTLRRKTSFKNSNNNKRRRSDSEESETFSRPTLRARVSIQQSISQPTPRRTTRGSGPVELTPALGDRTRSKSIAISSTFTSSPSGIIATSSPRFRPSASKATRKKFPTSMEVKMKAVGDQEENGNEEEETEETIIFSPAAARRLSSTTSTSVGLREDEGV